jgi:hypothetical protein
VGQFSGNPLSESDDLPFAYPPYGCARHVLPLRALRLRDSRSCALFLQKDKEPRHRFKSRASGSSVGSVRRAAKSCCAAPCSVIVRAIRSAHGSARNESVN